VTRRPAEPRRSPTAIRVTLAVAAAALVAALVYSVACKQEAPGTSTAAPGSQSVDVRLGGKTFHLEIAATHRARMNGLMHRPSLAADRGMLFVFGTQEPRAFWMRNVTFPLDIIYIDEAGTVVSIKVGNAYDDRSVPSDAPMRYAIELNKGAAASAGLKVGDHVEIPPEVREPKER
jgi:uncharacterized membrane protein (UPF0127 family)